MTVGYHTEKAAPGSPLAKARMAAHTAFDSIWKSGHMPRSRAYLWLAEELDVPPENCHFRFFDAATCERAQRLCDVYMFNKEFMA